MVRRRRILLLSPAFPPSTGGIERTAAALADGLRDFDLEVVSGEPPSAKGMTSPHDIPVRWAPNDPPYGRRATLALTRLALAAGIRFRPDVILALHIRTMPAARALAKMTRSRIVLVVHAKEMREQPGLARAACAWADAIVAVSRFSRELSLEAGAAADRITIIHPGVTTPPSAPTPLVARPTPPTVISVARLSEPTKGHDVALAAMQRLHERLPDVRWLMVGEGVLRPALERTAAELGIAAHVTFSGALPDSDLARALNAAHVFCLLSRRPPAGAAGEGFGIAFIEAGAHGLPVVAGNIPGVVDAVENEVNGILIDPTDPDAAARAIERILRDQGYGQRLADGGLQRADELQWLKVVGRYRDVLGGVLASPRRGNGIRGLGWIADFIRGPR